MKLNVKAFALTCGLLLGFGLLFYTCWLENFNPNKSEIKIKKVLMYSSACWMVC